MGTAGNCLFSAPSRLEILLAAVLPLCKGGWEGGPVADATCGSLCHLFDLIPALLGHALWGQEARWLGGLGLIVGGIVNCARPWWRLRLLAKELPHVEQFQAAFLVPVIRLVGDVAKIAGYPVGLLWRWRNRHRPEIHWRDA